MHGNVWEWCEDDWHENYIDAPTDGSAWNSRSVSNTKMLRGGSWYGFARGCRAADRIRYSRDFRNDRCRFRVVSSFRTL
ncbi:MAG: formylglycine-generating enzyme family protein, partial [Dolichospermum sp.]